MLGIDFGTNSTAAAMVIGRDITVVPYAGDTLSIPSVVSFTPSSAGGSLRRADRVRGGEHAAS